MPEEIARGRDYERCPGSYNDIDLSKDEFRDDVAESGKPLTAAGVRFLV